ncbi:hypothetical protein [Reinekea blandensis]|uniref:hypothetical protein n=1 Tax=Reinekea blandensis TaxID=374838 RepID=UPI0012B6741B|nr:hypothetical protein [Reinekea blandensis]
MIQSLFERHITEKCITAVLKESLNRIPEPNFSTLRTWRVKSTGIHTMNHYGEQFRVIN